MHGTPSLNTQGDVCKSLCELHNIKYNFEITETFFSNLKMSIQMSLFFISWNLWPFPFFVLSHNLLAMSKFNNTRANTQAKFLHSCTDLNSWSAQSRHTNPFICYFIAMKTSRSICRITIMYHSVSYWIKWNLNETFSVLLHRCLLFNDALKTS